MKTALLSGFVILFICAGYVLKPSYNPPAKKIYLPVVATAVTSDKTSFKNSDILARQQIPVLCYHQIRDWRASDSKRAKDYIVPVAVFKQQLKMLADSGYHTISPDELYDYLTKGSPLPSKPIMLTYDDTDLGQFTVAYPEMQKYNFKGLFFIMTVSLNRPNYMSRDQVKQLSDAGNTIGSHTWDHHNVKQYKGNDWKVQLDKPTQQLESITGKPIRYFAYPFGLWNEQAIPELKKRDFKAAFQLITKRDQQEPLYTIRRIIVPGYWSLSTLHNAMQKDF
ncbi:MAG TPA: polysaccharide deacetylase family protein [Puia sp.]|jgi:peptidoglycan/xylan/chitin deacetylase (PgdA/CDA1 family)|nr:polysaccharide deacetylase family protein [Puia sp.]